MTFGISCRRSLAIFIENKKGETNARNAVFVLGGTSGEYCKAAPICYHKYGGIIAGVNSASGNSFRYIFLSHNIHFPQVYE